MKAINLLKEFTKEAIKSNDIDAIVLSGSKTSLINDEMSDYDIYVYSKEKVNIENRKNFAEKYSSYYELGNDYFEYGDELIIENICFDFMYRDLSFVENEINYIWKNCNSKIGYTTAFLYNIKSATTEATTQKTQTPIVARLTEIARALLIHRKICIFIKFIVYKYKKGIIRP